MTKSYALVKGSPEAVAKLLKNAPPAGYAPPSHPIPEKPLIPKTPAIVCGPRHVSTLLEACA